MRHEEGLTRRPAFDARTALDELPESLDGPGVWMIRCPQCKAIAEREGDKVGQAVAMMFWQDEEGAYELLLAPRVTDALRRGWQQAAWVEPSTAYQFKCRRAHHWAVPGRWLVDQAATSTGPDITISKRFRGIDPTAVVVERWAPA